MCGNSLMLGGGQSALRPRRPLGWSRALSSPASASAPFCRGRGASGPALGQGCSRTRRGREGRSGPDVGLALAGTISIGGREGPSRLPSPLAAVTWLPREESVDSPVRRARPAGGEGLARPQPPALQREGEVTLAVRTAVWQVRTQHRERCLESFLFRDSLSGR